MERTLAEKGNGIGRQAELLLATSYGPPPTMNQMAVLHSTAWSYQTEAGNTKETLNLALLVTGPFARRSRMLL